MSSRINLSPSSEHGAKAMSSNPRAEPSRTRRSTRLSAKKASESKKPLPRIDEPAGSSNGKALHLLRNGTPTAHDFANDPNPKWLRKANKGKTVEKRQDTRQVIDKRLGDPAHTSASPGSEASSLSARVGEFLKRQESALEYLLNVVSDHERLLSMLPSVEELEDMTSHVASLEERASLRDRENDRLRHENELLHKEFHMLFDKLEGHIRKYEDGPPKFRRKADRVRFSAWRRDPGIAPHLPTVDTEKANLRCPMKHCTLAVSQALHSPGYGSSDDTLNVTDDHAIEGRKRKRSSDDDHESPVKQVDVPCPRPCAIHEVLPLNPLPVGNGDAIQCEPRSTKRPKTCQESQGFFAVVLRDDGAEGKSDTQTPNDARDTDETHSGVQPK